MKKIRISDNLQKMGLDESPNFSKMRPALECFCIGTL